MAEQTRTRDAVVCAAGPAPDAAPPVGAAQEGGWAVQAAATPAAAGFADVEPLEQQTGRPVRRTRRVPGCPRSPKADAVLAPASCATVDTHADDCALDVADEAIGRGGPVAVLPFVSSACSARKAFRPRADPLREEGGDVLLGPGAFEPCHAGSGDSARESLTWRAAPAALP
ncbi:hypothetical protein [Thermobifida cellulosilytica]|uniref:Uncharacterized protein n=1 Tax=Thermobifida cellulosilytica TB100 TaxID=665004 RepID=A0A147KMY2_THECS|nr:hypothetical protein [Thermobifida cellulosilytica]KUP98633.1 hypothetical protein AC529_00485 [Thermobifida cellulosilytica TB100]